MSNPVDATGFLTKPCAALTPTQLVALSLPAQGEPDTGSAVAKAVGPGCKWLNGQAGGVVGVDFLTGNRNGLADLYGAHDSGQFGGYWIETTIEGYPGVFADISDDRSSGSCNLVVGISNTLAFRAGETARLKDPSTSCDRAKQVAAAVIQTLKSGG